MRKPTTTLSQGYKHHVLLMGALALTLAGCGTENDLVASATDATTTQATPTSIVQTSAENYDDNVNGLITGSTLKRWISDWSNNKPAGVTGDLVILQATAGEAGYEFIASKPGVRSHLVSSAEWIETRSNGVIETRSVVPSGKAMDTFLAKYGIDPAKDMVVCSQGSAGAGNAMRAGRCWYMFRYWGTPQENVAQFNGGNEWNGTNTTLTAADFAATPAAPPLNGSASVKDLPEVNMSLQATVEDMLNIVPTQDVNLLNDGVFIWDARGNGTPGMGNNEYFPDDDTDHRNGGSTQGHPNGAVMLTYTNLLNTTAGMTFKTKAELESYMRGEADMAGVSFEGADLQALGAGNAYQEGDTVYTYCETTFRAMITGFASAAILGLPTRFYDGAMVEWHSLANVVASDGNEILPWDSPWRTDKSSISMFRVSSDPALITPRDITNAYAANANAVIAEDLAYKGVATASTTSTIGSSSGTTTSSNSGGGSSALPANPCGG